MTHRWLYRKSITGTCTVCQADNEYLVPNGNGHYVCMDAEGCYTRWKESDPAGINAEPVYVAPPAPPRRRRRR